MQRIIEAILHLLRGGLPWRMLPPCFPPVSTVRRWFYLWRDDRLWLKTAALVVARPRFTFYFAPTSCSWLNAVEGFFARLTRRRLKRGAFHSLVDLQAAINRFLAEHNECPNPFVWTADSDKIIAAVRRGHQVLDSHH